MCKGRYNSKRTKVDIRVMYIKVVQETADGEEYFE